MKNKLVRKLLEDDNEVNNELIPLIALVTTDGYLIGTTDDMENGWSDSFWSDREEGDLVPIEVPQDMVDKLLGHGTGDQYYSDGYEAWQEILKNGRVAE